MTIYNKSSLQSFFQQGDVPTGTNYADFIDSCVNMAETAVQPVAGPLNPTELITAQVSAGNGVFTGNVRIDGTLSAATISFDNITTSSLSVSNINTGTIVATGNISTSAASIYASAGRFPSGTYFGVATISAAGTAQATAATLTSIINRGRGVVDGQTTGFKLAGNESGLVKYLYNEGASANLWPPVGGFINGLAVNTPFPVAASSSFVIFGVTASAYGVK